MAAIRRIWFVGFALAVTVLLIVCAVVALMTRLTCPGCDTNLNSSLLGRASDMTEAG